MVTSRVDHPTDQDGLVAAERSSRQRQQLTCAKGRTPILRPLLQGQLCVRPISDHTSDPVNLLLKGTNANVPMFSPLPDQPGGRITSAVFSLKSGPSPAVVSLLILHTGDIKINPGMRL